MAIRTILRTFEAKRVSTSRDQKCDLCKTEFLLGSHIHNLPHLLRVAAFALQPIVIVTLHLVQSITTMGKPKQKINEEVTLNKYVAEDRSDSKSGVLFVGSSICPACFTPGSLLSFRLYCLRFQQEGPKEGYQVGGADTVSRRKRQQG
jgi:hypothetical protein